MLPLAKISAEKLFCAVPPKSTTFFQDTLQLTPALVVLSKKTPLPAPELLRSRQYAAMRGLLPAGP